MIPESKLRISLLVLLVLAATLMWRTELGSSFADVKARLTLDTLTIPSKLLSDFNQKPTVFQAIVVLPKGMPLEAKSVPIMYHFLGFGVGLNEARHEGEILQTLMAQNPSLSMVHVFVDASIDGGYSYFTDSPNNGPWESAFLKELVPAVETKLTTQPKARYLTGHSSGGWTALWLQLHNPSFFSGVWATSPDPADFSDFYGIDIRPGSHDNFYTDATGAPRPAARSNILGGLTLRQYVAADDAQRERGDIASYEWAFSSRSAAGKPLQLFDRNTGELNQVTLKDWAHYDLENVLTRELESSKSELSGKIHLVVGEHDDFFLERPTKLFCAALATDVLPSSCIVIPDRGHRDLYFPEPRYYPHGLTLEILNAAAGIKPPGSF